MTQSRLLDIFVTHAWRYHEDWVKICEILDRIPGFRWRNFSVPWHDPAMSPNSEVGGEFIRNFLETQIIPVHAVILLSGVYSINSARRWLDIEIDLARKHNKPIVAVPPLGETVVSDEIRSLADLAVGWDSQAVVGALEQVRSLPKYADGG